jgi:competence protein ComEA
VDFLHYHYDLICVFAKRFTLGRKRHFYWDSAVLSWSSRREAGQACHAVPGSAASNQQGDYQMRNIFLALCLSLSALFTLPAMAEPVETSMVSVNINEASAAEMAEVLQGVGESKAQAIVDYREENGTFGAVEDLTQVKGIGPSTLKNNEARIALE